MQHIVKKTSEPMRSCLPDLPRLMGKHVREIQQDRQARAQDDVLGLCLIFNLLPFVLVHINDIINKTVIILCGSNEFLDGLLVALS